MNAANKYLLLLMVIHFSKSVQSVQYAKLNNSDRRRLSVLNSLKKKNMMKYSNKLLMKISLFALTFLNLLIYIMTIIPVNKRSKYPILIWKPSSCMSFVYAFMCASSSGLIKLATSDIILIKTEIFNSRIIFPTAKILINSHLFIFLFNIKYNGM